MPIWVGNDYLMSEFFEIRMIGLNAATFSVEVQLFGTTNIWFMAVAYIAVETQLSLTISIRQRPCQLHSRKYCKNKII